VPVEELANGIIGFRLEPAAGGEGGSESAEESTPRKRRKAS